LADEQGDLVLLAVFLPHHGLRLAPHVAPDVRLARGRLAGKRPAWFRSLTALGRQSRPLALAVPPQSVGVRRRAGPGTGTTRSHQKHHLSALRGVSGGLARCARAGEGSEAAVPATGLVA